jgi:hypothetical protein
VSIGFTFDHGTANLGGDQVATAAVRRWLHRPMLTRGPRHALGRVPHPWVVAKLALIVSVLVVGGT